MSQLERLAEEKKSKKVRNRPAKANGVNANFVSFRPTKEDKEAIRADQTPLDVLLGELATWVEDGHKLTLGFRPENSAFYLSLREGGAEYSDAVSLSVWHTDLLTCFYAMKHALRGRYSDFPAIQFDLFEKPDW